MTAALGTSMLGLTAKATAKIVDSAVTLSLEGFPVAFDGRGERFTPTQVRIEKHLDVHARRCADPAKVSNEYVMAVFTGPPVEEFKYGERTAFFLLAGHCAVPAQQAPDWMAQVLRDAGVTW